MSRKFYAPVEVNNQTVSEEVTAWYFPLLTGNQYLSKKVIKAYCSVNGLSKLFYEAGGGGTRRCIWGFYSTTVETVIQGYSNDVPNPYAVAVDKINTGFAFYFIMPDYEEPSYDPSHWVILLSTDYSAVQYMYDGWDGEKRTNRTSSISYNGEVWYIGEATPLSYTSKPQYPSDYTPDCLYDYDFNAGDAVLNYMFPLYIYSDDFAQNYQVGGTYNLNFGDIRSTIRRTLGIFIFKRIDMQNDTRYISLLNNLEAIVNDLMSFVGSDKWIGITITKNFIYTTGILRIEMMTAGNPSLTNKPIQSKATVDGYTSCRLGYQGAVSYPKRRRVSIASNGNISYQTITATGTWDILGVEIQMSSQGGNDYYSVYSSNMGLTL